MEMKARKRRTLLEPADMPNIIELRFTYGLSLQEIAEKFDVHMSTISKNIKKYLEERQTFTTTSKQ